MIITVNLIKIVINIITIIMMMIIIIEIVIMIMIKKITLDPGQSELKEHSGHFPSMQN